MCEYRLHLHLPSFAECISARVARENQGSRRSEGMEMGGGLGSRLKPRLSLQPWVSPCAREYCGGIKTPKAGD